MTNEPFSKKQLLWITVVLEGGLFAAAMLWFIFTDLVPRWNISLESFKIGCLGVLPLLLLNALVFGRHGDSFSWLRQCREFRDEVIIPLVRMLDWRTALFVSLLAGFGEEALFRGVLLEELGLVISSILFALLHFGPATRRYAVVVGFYVLFGAYLGGVYIWTESLFAVSVCHAIYDFIAILILRRQSHLL